MKFLSTAETAEFLGVQESTLAKWRSEKLNGLKYYKQGNIIKYKDTDLEAWIEEGEVK